MSHTSPYPHPRASRGSSAVSREREEKVRCAMTAGDSGDITGAKFLTIAEVAQVMRVSKMTVYRLVHNGELPAVRVGRSFRVTEEDVNEYLRKSFFQTG